MFDYQSHHLFVIAPRNAGGGLLSLLLSLDTDTASLDFKKKTLDQKIRDWEDFFLCHNGNSHLYGFLNVSQSAHTVALSQADACDRYIHKCHFYELDAVSTTKRNPLLESITGSKQAVGIYLTESCVEKLQTIRPQTPMIDLYQRWIYANQRSLLSDFYAIESLHLISFSDMMDQDILIDNLKYCQDLFRLDTDLDTYRSIISQWYQILQGETRPAVD